MTKFEMARFADLLPEDRRDKFASYANRASLDRLQQFVRYQLQMINRGFTPLATPSG
jgi:hypothetical protein